MGESSLSYSMSSTHFPRSLSQIRTVKQRIGNPSLFSVGESRYNLAVFLDLIYFSGILVGQVCVVRVYVQRL